MLQLLRRSAHPLFRRSPRLRSLVLGALDLAARPVLAPFRLGRPRTDAAAAAALESQTVAFNRAAEAYFASYPNPDHLLDKPFSEPESLSRRLIDLGILINGLRLRPGDLVLDLGAGTCWLSHLLNRFGCQTISVDVSPTALAIGRRLFESDPKTDWGLNPRFLAYDGLTLPVEAASVDQVVLYDAFHHIPNPDRLLDEMRRVLKPHGIVGMSEPGRGHSGSPPSVAETAATGVLESELVLEDIAERAIAAGFAAAHVLIDTQAPVLQIDARQLRPFMGGRGFAKYWKNLCAGLDGHHYILLFAGDPEPTTARPQRLGAVVRLARAPKEVRVRAGERTAIVLDLYNEGDTRWLHRSGQPGWTRVGGHLHRAGRSRPLIDYDWVRAALPHDVAPETAVNVTVDLPAIAEPGEYLLVVDLVIEGMAWFAQRGSLSLDVPIIVSRQ
jgi:SAM-dependent methyltransferase